MTKISPVPRAAQGTADERADKIISAIKMLLEALSPSEQEHVLRELRPIETPRAGEVLGTIVRLLPSRPEWSVVEIKSGVASEGVRASSKEVYNAIGYLARRGHVKRIGYGRYLVEGTAVVTSDELGGEPARNEDD